MADQTKKGMNGEDIRAGILQADDIMHTVQGDIKDLAGETRYHAIQGKDREEFLTGITQNEYDTLSELAFSMGPKGVNKLQSILQEMMAMEGKK